jgi:methionine synthase / methylenetetrahydrofolate reductase(NADPH)
VTLHDLLASRRAHLFDGAMGTMLYQKGVFINRCFDELVLRDPDLVAGIHRDYVQAGAELIETNTFGANRVKLAQYGLESRVAEINEVAARLAVAAANGRALVGGAIGPLGTRIEPFGALSREEARSFFREQAESLLAGGADFLVLETFGDLDELHQALLGAREAGDTPVIAQFTLQEGGLTAYGTAPETAAAQIAAWGADAVGLNCSMGPHGVLAGVERMARATGAPLTAQPNAGLPREIHGRQMYMASAEYMGKYTTRLVRAGARLVGGCCGTTPAHTRAMADALRALSPGRIQVASLGLRPANGAAAADATAGNGDPAAAPAAAGAPPRQPVPLPERSAWGRKLAAGEFLTTVEIVPPRGIEPDRMLEGVRRLKAAGVDAVNVPDGPRAQMRMGVLATAVLVEQHAGIEAVVHYTCRDRNLLGMLSDLIGAHALGLRNLLLITGDPPKMGPYPEATAVFDIDSIGLTNLVSRLNRGLDLGGNPIGTPTSFTVGVGANPGAVDLEHELGRFRWKVDAGAEYAITQPVFDPVQLVAFVEEIRRRGVWVPVIAGIWPLVSARNAEFMANEVPGVVVPPAIVERMRRASAVGKEAALVEGIAIAREMLARCRPYIQGVQVSAPFGKVDFALQVFEDVPGVAAVP